eukprot:Pgem_evm1s8068
MNYKINDIIREFESVKELGKKEIPDDVQTVLMGECTHGTEEFYRVRAEFIILCEADWTFMWHVNQYIHRKKSNMFPANIRFPKWMWKNKPFYDLIEWMRKRASSDGPFIFGLDCYCKEESKEEILNFLNNHSK